MYKSMVRFCAAFAFFLLLSGMGPSAFAQSATPLAPDSIQVSRVQYDGNTVSDGYNDTFPYIFNDPNVSGLQGSVWIDQFSSIPSAPLAGSLPLPASGSNGYVTSSFSSKSEGALMLSPNGSYLTYMGYQGADEVTNVSNSYSDYCPAELNPNTPPNYDREIALIGASGLISLTPEENAFSGDNPRAAITVDGNEFYMAGNSDSTEYTATASKPICGQTSGTFGPGLTIGARFDGPLNSETPPDLSNQLGIYFATDRTDETNKQHVKDNNWRGIGIYTDGNGNQQLYVSKGSGGNGDDGVFQVGNNTGAGLPTGTGNTIVQLLGAQATNPTTGAASPYTPFGFWFANPTTLYVADEGYANLDGNGNLIPDPLAGLEKWSLVGSTWTLDYTIQAGLNLYQPQNIVGYPAPTYPTGIRNIAGWDNGDGTVTIFAITGQYSTISTGEPDPTSLVGITDSLAATTLPASEQFVTLQNSGTQQVYRGVAFIPPASGFARAAQTVTFPNPGPVNYGVSPITLNATATSGWPVVYSLVSGPATLSGSVLTITGAGSVVVQASQSGNTDYAPASVQDTIVVNPEATTVTWSAPAPITYGTPLSGTQLNATASVAGTFAYTPGLGTVLSAGLQTLSVTFTPSDSNYTSSNGSVILQVNQALPTITWSTPAAITYGTPLSGTQLNATASVPGSFMYSPGLGTILGVGSQTLSATFTPTDSTDYSSANASVSLQVTPASQTITFTTNAPASAVYNSSFAVAATGGGSGNPVTFTSSGSCSNSGATYTMTSGAGKCSVIANQAGNGNYTAAPQVTETVTAAPASQTINVTVPAPPTAINKDSFTVVANATSGLPITFNSSGACTNAHATYTMSGTVGAVCTVTMFAPSSVNYTAAPMVTEMTTVAAPIKPTVSLSGEPATAVYGSTFSVTASSDETGVEASIPVISSTTPTVCSVSGSMTNGTSVTATVTMLTGIGTCDLKATWAANYVYSAATATAHTKAVPITPTVSFTGAPASANNGTSFTVTAASNESGSYAVVPTITTTTGTVCSVGLVTSNGPGSYQATVTMTRATGTCKTKAAWTASSDYAAASATQSTTAQ